MPAWGPIYTISEKTPFSAFMAEKQEAVSKRCFHPIIQNEKRSINYKKDGKAQISGIHKQS
jgi:hypothetical protein